MASVVLCKDDGLWAMLPERSGGEAYSLRRVDAATSNSAEALAAVAAVASGSACIIDLQRYRDAVTRLSHAELVQVRAQVTLQTACPVLPLFRFHLAAWLLVTLFHVWMFHPFSAGHHRRHTAWR